MNKKFKYIVGSLLIFSVIILSVFIVNFFEIKDNDAVKGDLVIWSQGNTYEYLKKSADDFMELNGKVNIKVVQVSEEEIESAIAANNIPDIVQLSSNKVRELASRYTNISFAIDESTIGSFSKNYAKSRISEITTSSGLLGVPLTSRPLVLYLREDMLESYGYKYSQVTTWDDLINIGKDIKEKSGGQISILNAVDQDYEDLKSLLIMQAMEEEDDEEKIKGYVDKKLLELIDSGILNNNKNGQFLARISSINGMYEMSRIEENCKWVTCNAPSKYNGGNRFYNSDGDNLVILKDYEKNNKLINKFMDYIAKNSKAKEGYILNGNFFSSFLSVYNARAIEMQIKNFVNISPIVVMDNIYTKAPSISDYDLYFKMKRYYN